MRDLHVTRIKAASGLWPWGLGWLLAFAVATCATYFWIGSHRLSQPAPTGMYVGDRSLEFACQSGDVEPGTMRLEEKHVVFAERTCDIIFRRNGELPMAGDGPLKFVEIGYRCGSGGPGPRNTDGDINVSSGRAELTSYIAIAGETIEYIPAHSTLLSCSSYFP